MLRGRQTRKTKGFEEVNPLLTLQFQLTKTLDQRLLRLGARVEIGEYSVRVRVI